MATSERGKKNHFKNIEIKEFFPAVNGINLGFHDFETLERGKKNHSKNINTKAFNHSKISAPMHFSSCPWDKSVGLSSYCLCVSSALVF